MKCKIPPEVEIDTLVFNKKDWLKTNNPRLNMEPKIEKGDKNEFTNEFLTPEIKTDDKINCIISVINNFDLSLQELIQLDLTISSRVLEGLKKL